MVLSDAAPSTPTTPAPALAAYSTSVRPASIVFMSATMVCSGNSALSVRTAPRPSALISGVPASTQSAPPAPAPPATSLARHLDGARQVDEVQGDLDDGALLRGIAGGACGRRCRLGRSRHAADQGR